MKKIKNMEQSIKFIESQPEKILYPLITSSQLSKSTINGREMVMLATNDYLGLSQHPKVKEFAQQMIKKYGTSCCGSRLLNGTLDLHLELEELLSKFLNKDETLIFSTGMQTNLGVISCLANDTNDYILSDRENHASIIDAIKLSNATSIPYKHNDMIDLENKLKGIKNANDIMIVSDGVFSMKGDIVHLNELHLLAKKYNAKVYIDDAHSLGLLGATGKGTAEHFNLDTEVDYKMGVFSKVLGSIGGFISADKATISHIKYYSRSLMFSATLPPAQIAAALMSMKIIAKSNSSLTKLESNIKLFSDGLDSLGLYNYNNKVTPIQSILIGDSAKAVHVTTFLMKHNIFTAMVLYPAVDNNSAILRCSITALHTHKDLMYVLEILKKAKKLFNL